MSTTGLRYAGFWIRVLANTLDLLWLAAVNIALRLASGAGLPAPAPLSWR